jgi:hypothetical protein
MACSAAAVWASAIYIRQYQIDHGVAKADAYTITMYIMAGLLVIGFICNYLMTSVDAKHHIKLQAAGAS